LRRAFISHAIAIGSRFRLHSSITKASAVGGLMPACSSIHRDGVGAAILARPDATRMVEAGTKRQYDAILLSKGEIWSLPEAHICDGLL
jgi:hypothetical protein